MTGINLHDQLFLCSSKLLYKLIPFLSIPSKTLSSLKALQVKEKMRKSCEFDEQCPRLKRYTSFDEIVPYSSRIPPWWKKALSGPSPEVESNFIVTEYTLGSLLNGLPRRPSALSCLCQRLKRRLSMVVNVVSVNLKRYSSKKRIAM